MPPNQRYLPVLNAPIVVSKEMQEYLDFYTTLEVQIQKEGLEADYALRYMEQKRLEYEENLKSQNKAFNITAKKLDSFYFEGEKAFRINLVQQLEAVSYRRLHILLAGNSFLQNFCRLSNLDKIVIPSKSLLQKYATLLTEEQLLKNYECGVQNIFSGNSSYEAGDLYGDTTCIQANMHYPVDWLFIVDGIRTMLKAIKLIRKQGLKKRMDCPESFMTKINKLSIEMSGATRTKDANKKRKAALRKMKDLEKIVRQHGQRHLDIFINSWEKTEYSEGQANQIINRLNNIIDLMPKIIWQAHERIIGERQVDNAEKILSLYQDNVHVIVRKKIGAQREFGNQLLLVEQEDGFIVDYSFNKDKVEHDSKMVPGIIERFKVRFSNITPDSFCGDRGFSSPSNSTLLKKENVFNAICPKSVKELTERLKENTFRVKLKRRGPNEARVAIFKNKFSKLALRVKGYTNRHKALLWGLIAHNLFVEVNAINAVKKLQIAA
jgi:hypothetical protein